MANAVALLLSGGISKVFVLLVAIFAFKGLSKDDAGVFQLAYGLGFIFALFTEIGIRGYLLRELARRREKKQLARELFGDIFNARVVLTLAATPLVLGLLLLMNYPRFIFVVTLWFYLYAFIDSVSMMLKFALRAYERMGLDAVFSIIGRGVVFFAVAILWYNGRLTVSNLIVAHLIASVIECVSLLLVCRLLLPIRYFNTFDWPRIKSILIKSFPFAVINLIGLLYLKTSIIALSKFVDEAAVALFSAAERLPEASLFIPMAIVNALIPTLARSKNQPDSINRMYNLLVRLVLMIGLYLYTVIMLCPDWILPIISKREYLAAAPTLCLCGIWMVAAFLQYVTANVLTCLDQEKWVMRRYTWMCLANIVLTVILVPLYGLFGSAMALAISQVVATGIDIIRLRKHYCFISLFDLLVAGGVTLAVGTPILFPGTVPHFGITDLPEIFPIDQTIRVIMGLILGAVYMVVAVCIHDRELLLRMLKRQEKESTAA